MKKVSYSYRKAKKNYLLKNLISHALVKKAKELYYRLNYEHLPKQIRTINI